jgi:hypothetical protein
VARGHYEIQSAGLPAPWSAEFDRVLQERYGIEDRMVGGGVISMAHRAYIEGYNRVGMARRSAIIAKTFSKRASGLLLPACGEPDCGNNLTHGS